MVKDQFQTAIASDSAQLVSQSLSLENLQGKHSMETQVVAENGYQPLILIAEDNEANILTISGFLEMSGYRLEVARDGQEAIALAQESCPDLILMDVQMPEIDGLAATRYLRSNPDTANIPIVILTALAMVGDRERCLESGASAYLSKPVKFKELLQLVKRLLQGEQ
ncbi:MAG TPA: response regulator [Trichocoleus sp.]